MKTVKIYKVRKPSDIAEVKELCRRYNAQAEEVTVAETVNLPPVWYNAVCRNPLDDYIFLSAKGKRFGHESVFIKFYSLYFHQMSPKEK